MRMPISKPGGAKFRGPTSSREYNQNEDDKYLDLIELYKQSNANEQQLNISHNIVMAENVALHQYVKMLEKKVEQLEDLLVNMENALPYTPAFFKTAYVHDMTTVYPNIEQDNEEKSFRCELNPQYRYATIPIIHQIPKTHVVNEKTEEIVVPEELKIKVGRKNEGGEVNEGDVYAAFNGDNTSYWQRTVAYDIANSPSEEDVTIEIELPTTLVNNLNINTIQIHPHPENGIVIQNIEIHYQNAWEQIPGFIQHELSSVNGNEYAPRKKWYFPNKPVQKIRVTMVQKNPIESGGKKIFVLGAQEIGVYQSMFESSGGIVLTPFEMDGIYNIESIEHIFLNRNSFSYDQNLNHELEGNIYEYDLLYEAENGMLIPIEGSWSGQYHQKIWVRTRLMPDPHNGVTPCLHAIRLYYSR